MVLILGEFCLVFLLEGFVGWFWIWGMVKESFSDFGFDFNFNVIFWFSVGLVLFRSGFGVFDEGKGDIVRFIFNFLLEEGNIILLYNGIFLSCWFLVFVFVEERKRLLIKRILGF